MLVSPEFSPCSRPDRGSRARPRPAGGFERWERVAVASAKQCGRAVGPASLDVVAPRAVCEAPMTPQLMLVEPGVAGPAGRTPSGTLGGTLVR